MTEARWKGLTGLLEAVGLDEEPMGLFYTSEKPEEGFTPKPNELPTREREAKGEIDWGAVFGQFSCVIGNIWRARRKGVPAWFSAENFGCPGGAFYTGYLKPQTETIVHYVSTGFPGHMEGEHYLNSPEECRAVFEYMDPRPAPAPYLVVKHLGLFKENEEPEFVAFFARPESMAGLHQLATFISGKPEAVKSPFGAGCSSLVSWPAWYREWGEEVAVLGGWDPSARKYFKTDELSLTFPKSMFDKILEKWPNSFLNKKAWQTARKKVSRSRRTWGEEK